MKKIYTIGRDEGCDIVVPDNTDVISRLHATIRVESNNKIFITDQSRNGTYVNGMKMSSNVEIPVTRKDVVSFAHIYNLDWSLIPKAQNGKFKFFILIVAILIIAGVLWGIIGKNRNGGDEPVNPAPIDSTIVVKQDTVIVKDTVIIESVKKTKPLPKSDKPIEKDTVKVETPKPIDNNPIY